MEVSLLLAERIASMFLMCLFGYAIVKWKLLKPSDSKILSVVLVYICTPCVNIYSFQIDYTKSKLAGLVFSILVVLAIHIFMIVFTKLIGRLFRLNSVERASIIYSNSGNMVIPLVTNIFGEEWLFYTTAFGLIQTILIWTHGAVLIGKNDRADVDIKKILSNPNIITILAGAILFLAHIHLPAVINDCFSGFTNIVGPVAMIVTGMLIGNADLKAVFTRKRAWLVCLCRLVLIPIAVIVMLRITGIAALHPEGKMILTIIMLAVASSVANMVTQQAQIFDNDPVYASSINVMSVVGCIATMPLMIFLVEALI